MALIGLVHKHGKAIRAINRDGFTNAIAALDDGDYLLSLKPFKPKRSVDANARYWAILTLAGRELGWHKDDLHFALKFKLLRLPDVDGMARCRRTSSLDTSEFAVYMADVEQVLTEKGVDWAGWQEYVE